MNGHRKILIITALAPPASGGTPTMLGRLLSQFPEGSFAILADPCTKKLPALTDYLRCPYYFSDGSHRQTDLPALKEADPHKQRPWYRLVFSMVRRLITALLIAIPFRKYLSGLFFDPVHFIRIIIGYYREGKEAVRLEKPDLLLAITDSGPSFIVSAWLSKKFHIPYCLFFFDLYKNNFHAPLRLITAFFAEKWLVKRAHRVFAAGTGIKQYYDELYGTDCITIPNSCKIPDKIQQTSSISCPMKVIYTGAIYWAQEEAIDRFKQVVATLPWVDFKIITFSPNKLGNVVSQEECWRLQREADVLFLPLAFIKGPFREVIRTAPTGKISEYLASGVPILVHAPPYAWISQYIRKHHAGLVVEDKDPNALITALGTLKDPTIRKELVENAYKLAQAHHEVNSNSRLLYKSLQN